MTAPQHNSNPTGHPTNQLDLLATIDEFLRSSDDVYQLLAAFCSTGPADNGRLTACTIIDLFSFTIADLRHRTSPDRTDTSAHLSVLTTAPQRVRRQVRARAWSR